MRKIATIILFALLCGCTAVRATGRTVEGVGEGTGHALSAVGEGTGHIIEKAGDSVERAANESDSR